MFTMHFPKPIHFITNFTLPKETVNELLGSLATVMLKEGWLGSSCLYFYYEADILIWEPASCKLHCMAPDNS